MPAILDKQRHVLGIDYGAKVVIRHQGRIITVDSRGVTIICEECGEPVAVFLDTADSLGLGLATTK